MSDRHATPLPHDPAREPTPLQRLRARLRDEKLLLALVVALPPLLLASPMPAAQLPRLVHWSTIGALAGLMVLSRGLEDSGYLERVGGWLLLRVHGVRTLGVALVMFAAALSTIITNDVALFIVVPLTLSLRRAAALPIGRLVVLQALAVNAGSALSPVGNPQNIFLWQASGVSFARFTLAMAPLAAALMLVVVALAVVALPRRRIDVAAAPHGNTNRTLLATSLLFYPVLLVATDLGYAFHAAAAVTLAFGVAFRSVLRGVDWLLLVVFVLMFVDLGLLAGLPALAEHAARIDELPGGALTAGILLSQLISNVPAAIFLQPFTEDWRVLAWGVSVGGFGLAVGSLANLIALRLAREPGLWRDFHRWSAAALLLGTAAAAALLAAQ